MKLKRLLKSLLKTGVYIMDQATGHIEQVSGRASQIADQAKSAIHAKDDHTLRNVLSFAVGVGLGVGAGMLLAPSSGADTRDSIMNMAKKRISTKGPGAGVETL
ncbi:MAG TPA: hypothetical protein VFE61_21155 [Candidatus Sulfotelmatobacter sp.]|jgi:hypothetical protein|nr:hypothetical protein [Candidatus Sulfotelmatobacter sp.]